MSEPRVELARALQTYLTPEQVSKLIDEILAIEKRKSAEFKCRECGQRQMQWVTIPDAKAVTSSLTDLLSQAFGRPQEASSNTDPIQFYRLTTMEEAHALRLTPSEPDYEGESNQIIESEDSKETLRQCRACGELKPSSEFPARGRNARLCNDCRV